MMSFLKSFLSGEKSADERALQDNMQAAKKRDVIALDSSSDEEASGCGTPKGGCGNCGCR